MTEAFTPPLSLHTLFEGVAITLLAERGANEPAQSWSVFEACEIDILR